MKNIFSSKFILAFIFSLSIFYLNAQEKGDFELSFLNGPTVSWLHADDLPIEKTDNRLGYKIHLYGEYYIGKRFSLTGGVGLSLRQGGEIRINKAGKFWNESSFNVPRPDTFQSGTLFGYRINYVDFPVGFKIRTQEFGKFRFYLHAPEISYGIRTKAKGYIYGAGINDEKINIKREIPIFNISWAIGVGTEYKIADDFYFIAGLRYFQSMTDITDDNGKFLDGNKENSKGILSNIDYRIGVKF